jgi:poly(glycerol-phosphate) alpha-glucosyltransferase
MSRRAEASEFIVPTFDLPAGSHYAITPSIPDHYAGMTASMLQRSRAFVLYAGVEVTILTYEHRTDNDDVRRRLRDRGALIDGMKLANLWEDLWSWSDAALAEAKFDARVADDFELLGHRGQVTAPLIRERRDADNRVVQIDHARPDGSILVSERRAGTDLRSRHLTLCDTQSRPLGTWHWADGLQRLWLDALPRNPVAWMIVDSKTSADALLRYSRPDVVKMHVVRGSHLSRGLDGPMSKLVSTRERVMENLGEWDAVVFLTAKQRDDVEARFGPQPNLAVIPNSRNMPPHAPSGKRASGLGVMLASLDTRKQIDHAIEAVTAARKRLPLRRVRLDVWGQGPREPQLAAQIKRLRAPVKLRGHAPGAADEFARASFSLFTSRAEAFGNVLIESMGRGCIPISYDMPYGPSDIITHGVDGFLVPPGDKTALAEQIYQVLTTPESVLATIRAAGYRRALEFSDERQVERWQGVMSDVAARRGF